MSFPQAQKTAALGNNNKKRLIIQNHCTCQLPEYGNMVQCDIRYLTCINLIQAHGEEEELALQVTCATLLNEL